MVFSQKVLKAGPHCFLRSPASLCRGDAAIAEQVHSMATRKQTLLSDSPGCCQVFTSIKLTDGSLDHYIDNLMCCTAL